MNRARALSTAAAALVAFAIVALLATTYSTSSDWAAIVNGEEISERELRRELDQFGRNEPFRNFFPELEQRADGAVPADLASLWLTRLIQQELVEREIATRSVQVTDEHRRRALEINIQQFQGEGVFEAFDQWFRERLVERDARFLALVDGVAAEPTEAELREAFEADREAFASACAAHILVDTESEAVEIRAQLDAGADFAELAEQHSLDQQSAVQGGELGCEPRGTYAAPFDAAVFTLPIGTVSEPVETQFGFHLILVTSRDEGTFEEARARLEQQFEARAQEAFGQFLFDLVDDAEVEINPKYGSFQLTPQGPRVLPPEPPAPPQGRPGVDDGPPPTPDFFPVTEP